MIESVRVSLLTIQHRLAGCGPVSDREQHNLVGATCVLW